MKRLPNLDEQESGHDRDSATLDGQMDILDYLDALDATQWGDALNLGAEA